MPRTDRRIRRRTVLRATATAGLAVAGLSTAASAAEGTAATDCCVCWVDVKPGSCPNSINPGQGGVVSVTAGKPGLDDATVELVPVSEACAERVGYDPAFDECQDYRDQQYATNCAPLRDLRRCEADGGDRSASPVRSSAEDADDDGDADTVFKFEIADLELRPDDAYLLLTGESADDDCRVYGIDSVRIVDRGRGNDTGHGDGNANRTRRRR